MEEENKMDKHADVVNHPAHYELSRFECAEMMEVNVYAAEIQDGE